MHALWAEAGPWRDDQQPYSTDRGVGAAPAIPCRDAVPIQSAEPLSNRRVASTNSVIFSPFQSLSHFHFHFWRLSMQPCLLRQLLLKLKNTRCKERAHQKRLLGWFRCYAALLPIRPEDFWFRGLSEKLHRRSICNSILRTVVYRAPRRRHDRCKGMFIPLHPLRKERRVLGIRGTKRIQLGWRPRQPH